MPGGRRRCGSVPDGRRSGWRQALALLVTCALPFLAGVTGASSAGAQVTVAVSTPASVSARTPVLVRVEVNAPAGATIRLAPPSFAPFKLTRTDRAPTDTAGLRGRQRLEWRFVLLAADAGTFAFEPFEADVVGPGLRPATFRSLAWSVAVLPAPARVPPMTVAAAGLTTPDPARLVFDAQLTPDRVYVGEQTTLELRVGVGARVRERLRRSPEFAFPSISGVVTYDLSARHASSTMGDVHVYRRALFPLAPGVVDVPAAQLTYALAPEDDPFGVEQRTTARTPLRRVVAVAPPMDGRPPAWDGAVGRFRASARVDTVHARVGDAVVYTLRVEGVGNVLLLPRPPLGVPWADVSTAGERVTVDSTGDLAGGAKEFDWLLTPRAAGALRVPGAHYAYFDPRSATYAFADAAPVAVRVAPGATPPSAVASAPTRRADVAVRSALGVRRRWDGDRDPVLVARRGFWLALAAVPAPGALWLLTSASLARLRRRRSVVGDAGRGRERDTPRGRATAALAEFTAGLSRLLGGPGAPALDAATLVRGLRRAGVSRALADECAAATDEWARVAYGSADTMSDAAADAAFPRARALLARVARELDVRDAAPRAAAVGARHAPQPAAPDATSTARPSRRAYAGVAVGLAMLTLAIAVPQLAPRSAPDAPASDRAQAVPAFNAGVAAYADGDPARARDLFIASAAAAPSAPAAWLNAGTAAWAVADTAGAAFAWQRAAHLAPALPGLRQRLDRLPSVAAVGHLGAPPAIDPGLVSIGALAAAAAAALWMLASAAAHARRAPSLGAAAVRAPRWSGALALYLVAVALGGAAAFASRALDVRGLAVIRAPVVLRPEPAPGAFGAAPVVTGEVAQVVADEGGWRRVRLDGDRDGWLRSAQVAPLDGTP